MRIIVVEHYGNERQAFEGTDEDIRHGLCYHYPWLGYKVGLNASLEVLISSLDRAQGYTVFRENGDIILKSQKDVSDIVADHLGYNHDFESLISAGTFITGKPPSEKSIREGKLKYPHDDISAVLHACGLSQESRDGMMAVKSFHKAEMSVDTETIDFGHPTCEPVLPEGKPFSDMVNTAIGAETVFSVRLDGKHSKGSAVAEIPEVHIKIMLKPGYGQNLDAAGVKEESASQSKREAAFSNAARNIFGCHEVPEVHLLLIGGKEYAAGKLLPFDFKNMNRIRATDPGAPRRVLTIYRPSGALHRWAAMDYIMGNPDRNAGNIMMRGESIGLIDHGSAFAGHDFSPATDNNSFVPYYLRALCPDEFESMSPGQKLLALPRVHKEVSQDLGLWLSKLKVKELASILYSYGIDAKPAVDRLNAVISSLAYQSADLAILSPWVI
jgi:hypothetical protein